MLSITGVVNEYIWIWQTELIGKSVRVVWDAGFTSWTSQNAIIVDLNTNSTMIVEVLL